MEQRPEQEQKPGTEEVQAPVSRTRRWSQRLFRLLRSGIAVVLLLFLALYFALQIPAVQNWTVNRISRLLSNTLHTKVTLDHVSIAFFDRLILDGLYIEDLHGDTLLYSERFHVNINSNLFSLIRKRIAIEEVSLEGTTFKLTRYQGEALDNLQALFIKPTEEPSEGKKRSKPFWIDLDRLYLDRVHFIKEDSVAGKTLSVYVGSGVLHFDEFKLQEKRISIEQVDLEFPEVSVLEYQGVPLPAEDGPAPGAELIAETIDTLDMPVDTQKWLVTVDRFDLREGQFELHNYRKEPVKLTPDEILNYRHLEVYEIGINIRDFRFSEMNFAGKVNRIAFKDQSGFQLEELSAKEARVSPDSVQLYGMSLVTPQTRLGDTLILAYNRFGDFGDYPNRVRMYANFDRSKVHIDDIMVFAPGLENNLFFRNNRDEIVEISGQVLGKVNTLKGKNLQIRLAEDTYVEGNFSSFNLTDPDLQSMNLRLDRLLTRVETLRELIPNFNPPPNFDRLGRLDFSGYYDGFFHDFVAYGELQTPIGKAVMDMQINLAGGREKARYSGNLSLLDFDLGKWSNSSALGKITGTSRVIDGVGLTGASADARLEAKIDSLFFRNYQYKNLTMEGKLNKNLFDGDLTIQDDNIDLEFKGSIDFTESEPTFRFGADIRRLDLYRLNLIGKDYVVSGTVDLNLLGADLAKIRGRAAMSDLTILHQGNERFEVDSIVASSAILADGQKRFTLQSDLFQAELQGRYDLADLPETFLQFFERNYPIYARKLIRDSAAVRQIDSSRFTFELQINDTKGLTQLVHPKLGDLPATRFSGFVDTFRDSLAFDLEMPLLTFGNLQFEDVVVLANFERNVSDLDLAIFSTRIGSKTELAPIKLLSDIQQDTVNFSITAHDFNAVLNKLELDGRFFPLQEEFIIQFAESDLVIWNSEWHMKRNNFLLIGKNEVRTRNFVLNNGDRQVVLESIGNRGLYCDFRHFELGIVNDLWEYPPLDFAGAFDLEVKVEDIFEMKGISFSLEADTLRINSDDWGGLRFDAQAASLKSSFETFLTVTRPDQQLLAEGYYNPPSFEPSPGRSKRSREANYFDLDIHVASYPARILEYWIGSGISKTVGSVDGQVRLYGPLNRPNIEGEALLLNAATTIDYLNTRYSIERHQIHIDNELFDLKGAEIRDERGKTAVVSYGGITHDHLKNLGVNVTVKARDFLMLNTQKGQNELYYGTAIGTGDIRFTGSFQRTDIYVQARSEAGTRLVIPASSGRDASEVRFIRFSEKKLGNQGPPPLVPATQEITGVRIDMDLDITDDALVEIVFDEQAGDILRGRGNGTLQIVVTRTFDFFMYGEYVVSSGDYLFTLMNLVNKPFEVKPNGTIRWSGDPYGAQIDIEAQYKDLKASLTNFIAEYLISAQDETKSAARLPTDVDLTMKLTGQLLNPDINFGIQFPKLTGELKNYSDSKLRVLRQDQNEMNRQVFGLIVIGQFLPSDSDFQGNRLGIGINTLTEMLSQQLSLYLTGLVSEWLTEDGLISGIDFDIAYNYFQSADVLSNDPNQLYRGNELQVRLKNYLFDDRLTVNVGGNFDLSGGNYLGADPNSGAYFAGDLVIEYILTKDKNLKIRFYQSTEPEIGGGRRNKTGLGLSYRKEFDTFSEFLKGLRFTTKKLKEGRDRD